MSIGNTPCYRSEPLHKTIRLYGDFIKKRQAVDFLPEANFLVDDIDSIYIKTQERIDNGKLYDKRSASYGEQLRRDPKLWDRTIKAARASSYRAPKPDKLFIAARELIQPKYFGIKAVYWAYKEITKTDQVWNEEFKSADFETFFNTVWKCSAAPSRIQQKAFEDLGKTYSEARKGDWKTLKDKHLAVKHLWIQGRDNKYKSRESKFRRLVDKNEALYKDKKYDEMVNDRKLWDSLPYVNIGPNSLTIRITKFSNGYIIWNRFTHEGAVLFWKDHERLLTMINGKLKLDTYFKTYDTRNSGLTKRMVENWNLIHDTLLHSIDVAVRTVDRCNHICKAFDTMQFTYYSIIASDISNKSYETQSKKWALNGFEEFWDVNSLLEKLMAKTPGVTQMLELMKTYKMLPCPDFCHFSGIPNLARQNYQHRTVNLDSKHTLSNGLELTISSEEFWLYQKRAQMKTFHARHGRLPGNLIVNDDTPEHLVAYPLMSADQISLSDMNFIDFEGAFMWHSFNGIEHELVKDKTITASSEVAEGTYMKDGIESNQVLKYLFDPQFQNQDEVNRRYYNDQENWNKKIKIAWKAEAKKPDSRLFQMKTDEDRRVLSEFEKNLFEYIKHRVGVSIGGSDMDLHKKMASMNDMNEPLHDLVHVSFDLAAWSPEQPPEFKELGLRKWAYCFGKPEIMKQMKIFNDREIFADKLGHTDSFKGIGVDVQGFHGKMNTDLHVDMMSYCVFKARQLGVTDVPAEFLGFIDDGLLKMLLSIAQFDTRVAILCEIIELVYRAFGQEISWDKTYISQIFQMYLNEVLVDGYRVTPGAKSFLCIGEVQDVPIPNLMDELMGHAASVRGAIKAGANHNAAYAAYVEEYFFSILAWSGYKAKNWTDLALRCFLPFNLSGFALNSIFSLSTNATFDSFEQSLANCRMIAKSAPVFTNWFKSRINVIPEEVEPHVILKNPRTMHFGLKCLNNTKFTNTVRSIVMTKSVNTYIRDISRQVNLDVTATLDEIVGNSDTLNATILELLWQIDPRSTIETLLGKLNNSETAAKVIGKRKHMALMLVYRFQAKAVIALSY